MPPTRALSTESFTVCLRCTAMADGGAVAVAIAVAAAATCETLAVTGGYGYMAGTYTEEGSRNGASLYVSEDRSSEMFFSERQDVRGRARRERRGLLPRDVIPGELRSGLGVFVCVWLFAFRGPVRWSIGVRLLL